MLKITFSPDAILLLTMLSFRATKWLVDAVLPRSVKL